MKTQLEGAQYDTRMELSDWRYCASIVGLVGYFKYMGIDYYEGYDYIDYNQSDINEEQYLKYTEYYFREKMHHCMIEELLELDDYSEEQIELVNKKLKANSVMKKVFKGMVFTGKENEQIMLQLNENRKEITKQTYKNGKSLYFNYNNSNNFLSEGGKACRVLGYYFDAGKKSKSISYKWDYNTYCGNDEIEFDFIPFAFSKSRESFFVNNNMSLKRLLSSNRLIINEENPRSTLFQQTKDSVGFIEYEVEIIIKERDEDHYKTLFVRKEAIEIFKNIKEYSGIKRTIKVSENNYLNLEKKVTHYILNKQKLDLIIEQLLKQDSNYAYSISSLIQINSLIYGGGNMDNKMKDAYFCAKQIREDFMRERKKNKLNSYKQKLISALTFKDYDRFCTILLQLSAYTNKVFNFAYDLFEDFEGNKNLAYTFVNGLNWSEKTDEKGEK